MNSLQARLAESWLRFQDVIGERVATIERSVAAAETGELPGPQSRAAAGEAHKLVGSLGTFGLMSGSDVARRLEEIFQAGISVESTREAAGLAERLRSIVDAGPQVEDEALTRNRPSLLVMLDDPELRDLVAEGAASLGVDGVAVADPAAAMEWMSSRRPAMSVIDLDFDDLAEHGASEVMELLIHRFPESPVLVLSTEVTIEDRIRLASSGNCGFLQKPAQASEILDGIGDLIAPHSEDKVTVLALDDDPQILEALGHHLGARFHLITEDNSRHFWGLLEEVASMAVLLDVDMPSVNGIELCRAIRSD